MNEGDKEQDGLKKARRKETKTSPQAGSTQTTEIGLLSKIGPNLERISNNAWEALGHRNKPPRYFRFAGVPARIEESDEEEEPPRIGLLDKDKLRHVLAREAIWYRDRAKGDDVVREEAMPPKDMVIDMLAHPKPPLPPLMRIVESPELKLVWRLVKIFSRAGVAEGACRHFVKLRAPKRCFRYERAYTVWGRFGTHSGARRVGARSAGRAG